MHFERHNFVAGKKKMYFSQVQIAPINSGVLKTALREGRAVLFTTLLFQFP